MLPTPCWEGLVGVEEEMELASEHVPVVHMDEVIHTLVGDIRLETGEDRGMKENRRG